MNQVIINGRVIEADGRITIKGNNVYVNGKLVEDHASGVVQVTITGDPLNIDSTSSIEVNGNVLGHVNAGGSVSCGSVGNNVNAGGSVNCDDIKGKVLAGGSINCRRLG